jgi:hypothetical protein
VIDEFGDSITLTLNALSITLRRSDNKFRLSEGGDGYLDQLGYDRVIRPETDVQTEDHVMGDLLIRQVAYGIKHEFGLRLTQLTLAEAQTLEDMVVMQRKTKGLIRLSDRILPYAEVAPRTRVLGAVYANPHSNPGMAYYYTDFLVWLQIENRGIFDCQVREMDLVATEYGQPIAQ